MIQNNGSFVFHISYLGRQYKESVCQMFADSFSQIDLNFCRFAIVELMKLVEMAGVMDEANHTYYIRRT